MRLLIILTILLGIFITVGCDDTMYPVPENTIKSCLDSGGTPEYYSNHSGTTFKCIKDSKK